MNRNIGLLVVFAAIGITAVEQSHKPQMTEPARVAKLDTSTEGRSPERVRSGKARARRDRQGHYKFDAQLNGKSTKVLVDTGASTVAINESLARRIGLNVQRSDFRHIANTANGQVKMARKTIRKIQIDGIVVRDVEAAVLPDSSLDGVLLGMSFLNRLKRFQFEGNQLVLTR